MPIQITREEYERKFGKPPAVSSIQTPTKKAPVKITRAEYDAKFNKPFKYDVPVESNTQTRQQFVERAKNEAIIAEREAQKYKGLGFFKQWGKAAVETIAPSEVGLGQTIQKTMGNQSKVYVKSLEDASTQKVATIKAIREKEARGEDASNLKRAYNAIVDQEVQLRKGLGEETTLPTTGEVLGQIGGTTLDVVTAGALSRAKTGVQSFKMVPRGATAVQKVATATGLPELGKIATQKASGLFTKQGAKNIAIGAGIGYGYDVTSGMQGLRGEDREGAKSLIPGLGTLIGAGIPAISEGVQSIKNVRNPVLKAEKLITKRRSELDKLDSLQSIKKATEKGRERGIDIKKVLSETDVLHGAVDKNGTITTKGAGGAIEQYTDEFVRGNEDIVSKALQKEGRSIAPGLIKQKLKDSVMRGGIEGKELTKALNAIDDEIAGYTIRSQDGGAIPLNVLHDAKIGKYDAINFFTEGNVKKYDKTVAKALKELVEDYTTSVDVKAVNKELSKHYAVLDYLGRLDGKKVEGGRLGKYFAQTVGAMIGSKFGVVGGMVGAELGGKIKGNLMSRVFSGRTGRVAPQADIITEAKRVIGEKPLELPQSKSNSLGSLQNAQTTNIMNTNTGIPESIPNSLPQVKPDLRNNKQAGFI